MHSSNRPIVQGDSQLISKCCKVAWRVRLRHSWISCYLVLQVRRSVNALVHIDLTEDNLSIYCIACWVYYLYSVPLSLPTHYTWYCVSQLHSHSLVTLVLVTLATKRPLPLAKQFVYHSLKQSYPQLTATQCTRTHRQRDWMLFSCDYVRMYHLTSASSSSRSNSVSVCSRDETIV